MAHLVELTRIVGTQFAIAAIVDHTLPDRLHRALRAGFDDAVLTNCGFAHAKLKGAYFRGTRFVADDYVDHPVDPPIHSESDLGSVVGHGESDDKFADSVPSALHQPFELAEGGCFEKATGQLSVGEGSNQVWSGQFATRLPT